MRLGSLNLHVVSDGQFGLDGGAMFGVVPKPLWEKVKAPDSHNRIRMGTNCVLVENGRDLVLVDSGIGDKHDEKFRDIYAYSATRRTLPESIRRAGFEVGDVTHVAPSHLHFDHCGWNTRVEGGRVVPTFPSARYFIDAGELAHGRAPNERDRASYFPENWEPLFAAGVAETFDGGGDGAEIVRGVRAVKAPGHNADMCLVLFDGGSDSARGVFWADLIPTVAHVPFPWIMGYDLYPLTTLGEKKRWIPRAAAESWLSVFEHDAESALARIVEAKPGRFEARPLEAAVAARA